MKIPEFMKNIYIACRLYKLGKSKHQVKNEVVIFFESGYGKQHGGLADRMKAIVGTYYIAKKNNMPFKIVFSDPFDLCRYLVPNKVNWQTAENEISYKIGDVRFFDYNPRKQNRIPRLSSTKQKHCYCYAGNDIIRCLNEKEWQKTWSDLYHELFKKSEYLESLLEKCSLPKNYICVHIRFINILEKFERGYENELEENDKKILLEKIFTILENIALKHANEAIYIFSDSSIFIAEALKIGYKTVMPTKKIGHISFCNDEELYDKTFIDFYAMANSNKVYSILGGGLYSSAFPLYAAIVGKQNYEAVNLDDNQYMNSSSVAGKGARR
ncbi:MAG: hypothetical protein NC313_05615 [Butyrivibrio sp.]|nr:hypothetical protein [Butyrivibrio sp.]